MNTTMMTVNEIRKAFVEKLKDADIPFVENRVYDTRTERAWNEEKCFLAVYTNSSSFDTQDTSPEYYKIDTDVVVDVVVVSSAHVDGVLYTIADIIDIVTGGVVDAITSYPRPRWFIEEKVASQDVILKSVDKTLNGDGETDKGAQSVTFTATWRFEPITRSGETLNDWRVMHTDIEFDNTEDVIADNAGQKVVTSSGLQLRVQQENNGETFEPMVFDTEIGGH